MATLNHADIWKAVDLLAQKHGLTPSGLARKAGLDATTFNKSKRRMAGGRRRWPSTESIAKILESTQESLGSFLALVEGKAGALTDLPVIPLHKAAGSNAFDEKGNPFGKAWSKIGVPSVNDPKSFAIKVTGTGLAPVFRNGDILVASPKAKIRPGDRIVLRNKKGEVMVREAAKIATDKIDLRPLKGGIARAAARKDFDMIARIIWVGQ